MGFHEHGDAHRLFKMIRSSDYISRYRTEDSTIESSYSSVLTLIKQAFFCKA